MGILGAYHTKHIWQGLRVKFGPKRTVSDKRSGQDKMRIPLNTECRKVREFICTLILMYYV